MWETISLHAETDQSCQKTLIISRTQYILIIKVSDRTDILGALFACYNEQVDLTTRHSKRRSETCTLL